MKTEKVMILVVDDDLLVRQVLEEGLLSEGYNCFVAETSGKALNLLGEKHFDVVITDIKLPDINGIDLTKIVKNKFDSDVIIITGYTDEYKYEEAIEAGACDFIGKPINLKELVLRLKRIHREREALSRHKQAEKALKESEDTLRLLSEATFEAVVIHENGILIKANHQFLEMFGYEQHELIGKQVIPVIIAPESIEFMENQISSDSTDPYDSIGIKKDGTRFPIEIHAKPMAYQGRKIRVGAIRDLSERKKMEISLQESEKKYRTLLSNLPVGVYRTTADNRRLWANPSLVRMMGYESEEEYLAVPPSDIYADSQQRNLVLEHLLSEGKLTNFETSMRRKDGTTFDVVLDAHVTAGENGIAYFDGIMMDVTDRKRAEEALRKSEEKYRTILENIEEGYFEVSLAGNFTFFNDAMCKIQGYSRDELMGMNNRQYMTPETAKVVYKAFNDVYTTGKPAKNLEWETLRPDGSKRQVQVSASLMKDISGQPVGFRGLVRDVTEFKLSDRERKRLEAQLQQAQKMEAIGTLAGGIAHDFNNILMTIIGYAEIMDVFDLRGDSPVRPSLKEVLKASHRAKDLVQQILTFSRQTEIEKRPLQLSSIVKETLKFLKASLPSTIEIRRRIEDETGTVLAAPTQIHQVLMNLCTNAGHAMRKHGGVLEVSLDEIVLSEKEADQFPNLHPGAYLELTVSDTGHGIGHNIIERIFDPFFTTKERGEGTGMGLSVVHGIINNHDGAIDVESEPGKGSTFRIFLPLLGRETDTNKVEELPSMPTGNETILFVDDEESIVYLGEQILTRLGYKITGKTSSVEALEAFRAAPDKFDLVITDMTMPNKTGMELAKALLQLRPDIPIILCTGFSDIMSEETARSIGVRDFIMKPIVIGEMAQAIRQVLDKT